MVATKWHRKNGPNSSRFVLGVRNTLKFYDKNRTHFVAQPQESFTVTLTTWCLRSNAHARYS